jgi:hypothetical protein
MSALFLFLPPAYSRKRRRNSLTNNPIRLHIKLKRVISEMVPQKGTAHLIDATERGPNSENSLEHPIDAKLCQRSAFIAQL